MHNKFIKEAVPITEGRFAAFIKVLTLYFFLLLPELALMSIGAVSSFALELAPVPVSPPAPLLRLLYRTIATAARITPAATQPTMIHTG